MRQHGKAGEGRASRRLAAVAVVTLAACSDPPGDVSPDAARPLDTASFAFMAGRWEVTSRLTNDDGTEVVTTARSSIVSVLGVAWKEQWVGTRDGAAAEIRTLLGRSDQAGAWLAVRGDGAAGTFDVLEGGFAMDQATFVSRADSRPDGGLERLTLTAITSDGFTQRTERSADGGATWLPREEMIYRRAGTDFVLPEPPAVAAGCGDPEHRQFDFWAGDWMVQTATNTLPLLLGGCILEENWIGSERGTSFNMYDRRTARWTQAWMDDSPFTVVTYGGLVGDQMILQGRYASAGGAVRISWTPLAGDRVRQVGENSGDGGATWSLNYDLTYTPR